MTYCTDALARMGADTELVVQAGGEYTNSESVLEEYFGIVGAKKLTVTAIVTDNKDWTGRIGYYRKVKQLISARIDAGADIFITRSLSLLPLLLKAKANSKKMKVFFESHDFFSDLNAINRWKLQEWKNFFREKYYIPKTDGLICLQKTQADLYKRVFPNIKILHLPSGCRLPKLGNDHKGEFTAVYIGSFDVHKGVGDLLRIWEGWENPPKLKLIGGRNIKSQELLQAEIDRKKLTCFVKLIPWLNPGKVLEELLNCHIGLLPLQDTFFNRNLTFPLKMTDYIACGLPIISSKLPTIENVIKDNGCFFTDFKDEIKVRETVDALRNSKDLYELKSEEIKSIRAELSWERRAVKTLDFIRTDKMRHEICSIE